MQAGTTQRLLDHSENRNGDQWDFVVISFAEDIRVFYLQDREKNVYHLEYKLINYMIIHKDQFSLWGKDCLSLTHYHHDEP